MSENKFLESKSLHFKNLFPIEILRLINEFAGDNKLNYHLKREMKSKFVNKYGSQDDLHKYYKLDKKNLVTIAKKMIIKDLK